MMSSFAMWSVQDPSCLKPDYHGVWSQLLSSSFLEEFNAELCQDLTAEWFLCSVLPSLRSPFFGNFMRPVLKLSGSFTSSHTFLERPWKISVAVSRSAFNASAGMLSGFHTIPFFSFTIAFT